jgi:hypothetical protein
VIDDPALVMQVIVERLQALTGVEQDIATRRGALFGLAISVMVESLAGEWLE